MRMGMRRFTRLTNAFSKKAENLAHAVSLHFMYYNFGRVHQTIKTSPAVEASVADHIWSLEEIAGLLDRQGDPMTSYVDCPNGCSGVVPIEVEEASGPDPSVGLPNGSYLPYVDDEENAVSHDNGCPPLTEAQIQQLEDAFDIQDWLMGQAEAWAEVGL